ncbi:hypothetical protein [Parafrankia elaeagni]|uniref:hypothetical protein n=1 Tax=Parafrankia elaeagni TaxID=222534 RepID=UPI000550D70C|nr:hypothetical protein [Parafrankia elaeagni]
MMTLRGARLAAVALPLFLTAAACAGDTTGSDSLRGAGPALTGAPGNPGTPVGSGVDDTAVLRVDLVGGFVTPQILAARLPVVSVYPGGQVISEGPQVAIFPAPALPNVQLRRIAPADVQRLVGRAVAAGVGAGRDYGEPPVTDVPSTRFTVRTPEGVRTTEVRALAEADGTGLTAEQQNARRDIQELLDALTDLPGTIGDTGPYVPTAVAAIAAPLVSDCPAGGVQPVNPSGGAAPAGPSGGVQPPDSCGGGLPLPVEQAWPGPELPGEPLAEGLDVGCVAVRGTDATVLLAAARTAVDTTPWTSGGRRWTADFRPLLPDESGCADLRAAS